MKDENEKFKMERTNLHNIAMNILLEYVTHDYQTCNDLESPIKGYNYFSEGTSVENAFAELSQASFVTTESSDDDDDIEALDESEESYPKKAEAPKAKNLANKIQNNAMDKEAKFLKKSADSQRKGLEVKNAVKAVTSIPKHIVDSIKNTIADWDKMDDDRRKNYIIKPGFRKKAFRNLKLAVMYGAAAKVKLSLVPVVFMARHFSKKKDIRIRKELARELDTNIKVCEAKIEDAAAAGNNTEKYELMRIKSDLEKEAIRVKSNSKYV